MLSGHGTVVYRAKLRERALYFLPGCMFGTGAADLAERRSNGMAGCQQIGLSQRLPQPHLSRALPLFERVQPAGWNRSASEIERVEQCHWLALANIDSEINWSLRQRHAQANGLRHHLPYAAERYRQRRSGRVSFRRASRLLRREEPCQAKNGRSQRQMHDGLTKSTHRWPEFKLTTVRLEPETYVLVKNSSASGE